MNKLKLILTMALTFAVLFAQVGSAAAAPLAQTPTDITGTISQIQIQTTNGVTTVLVTLTDSQNVPHTVTISEATAISLKLLQVDGNNQPILDPNGLPMPVVLDPNNPLSVTVAAGDIIPDTTNVAVNPISSLLATFFGGDASIIDGYHNDGFGFGVIAQALWMSRNLTGTEGQVGDTSLAGDILQAKQDKDFAAFFEKHPDLLADGESIPTNWGQFRKAFSDKKNNLGVVVSGHGDNPDNSSQSEHGKGQGKDNNNGKGNGHNKP
jgi:hypothetical protein